MRSWLRKLVATSGGSDVQNEAAEGLAERAPQYRLESLEPRLLLSADPISSELARMVQENSQADNADAVAAIIQEVDTIVETNSADHSKQHDDHGVSWPEGWNIASENIENSQFEHSEIDLQSILTMLIGDASEALQAGIDADELAIQISDNNDDHQELNLLSVNAEALTSTQQSDSQEDSTSEPDGTALTIAGELLNQILDDVIQSHSSSSLADVLGDLSIELVDLEENLLAEIQGDTIYIDVNAAGHGWFIDPILLERLAQALADGESAGDSGETESDSTAVMLNVENTLVGDSHDATDEDTVSLVTLTETEAYTLASDQNQNTDSGETGDQAAGDAETDQAEESLIVSVV